MGRASNKINLGDSHMSENWSSSFPKDPRAERWRKRREAINVSWMQNRFASATKTTVKISGNMDVLKDKINQMVEDDPIDEEYKLGLPTYISDIDSDGNSDKNSGSNIDVNIGYTSDNDANATDEEYKSHFPTCVSDIDSTSVNDEIDEEEEEAEEERLHNKLKSDTNMLKDLTLSTETGNSENTKSGSMREQTSGQIVSEQGLDIERGPCNKTPCQDVSSNYRNNRHRVADDEYVSMLNFAHASCTPEVQCGIGFDKDYHLIIHPASIVDKNSTKTTTVEDGSDFSDSEIALVKPNSIRENTPFISSKTYDSSCFEKELNPRDGGQLSAADDSQFRRKLMKFLNSPYDQEEFDVFLDKASQQRKKERHLETRQGVLKSYHAKGVNKSYRELYPDLDKAITEFREDSHRVLFLLRGFFFWLQHLCYDGIFEPWRDETCLEILRKM